MTTRYSPSERAFRVRLQPAGYSTSRNALKIAAAVISRIFTSSQSEKFSTYQLSHSARSSIDV
jgi:hypothetical protein